MKRELDKEIAKVLGWKQISISLVSSLLLRGVSPASQRVEDIPRWETDANAALALVADVPFHLNRAHPDLIKDDQPPYECSLVTDPDTNWIGYGDTPAAAICKAWLQ